MLHRPRIIAIATLAVALLGAASPVARPREPQEAQPASTEYWKLEVLRRDEVSQTIYVTITPGADGEGYSGTFSNPARGVVQLPIDEISYHELSFRVNASAADPSAVTVYRGRLSADGTRATGEYVIDGTRGRMRMEQVSEAEVAEALSRGFDQWRQYALEQSPQIVAALNLGPATVLADVGAGQGEWAVTLAEHIGAAGHVYATEIEPQLLADTRRLMAGVGVANVTPILGGFTDSGLPDECCDVILLRIVYHEFSAPKAMLASLHRALRPGGTIAVIENPGDGDHDIDPEVVIADFTAAGFELVRRVEDWDVARQYCLLFTR